MARLSIQGMGMRRLLPLVGLFVLSLAPVASAQTRRDGGAGERDRVTERESDDGRRRDLELDRDAVRAEGAESPDGPELDEDGNPRDPEKSRSQVVGGGEVPAAVTPQSISLPNAEGSIQGMGESFAPVLSSGTATFTVPIAVPAGRGAAQPSLALSYASTNGNSVVGIGWNFSVPYIARQTDRGMPRHVDGPRWHPEEDRFIYNGGQELVPVDNAAMAAVDGSGGRYPSAGNVPAELAGWQQYRARVEGGFLRFFRSPAGDRWVVQGKDGTRFDFGRLPLSEGPPGNDLDSRQALQSEGADGQGRIHAWLLTRMSDANGNVVYYRYSADRGARYLTDIYYTQPASCGAGGDARAQRSCSASLHQYAFRVAFEYEARPDALFSYRAGWRVETARRLAKITVYAAEEEVGARYFVRRYHLRYDPASYHSLLAEVQVEGRPDVENVSKGPGVYTFVRIPEGALSSQPVGRLLPPMRFTYSRMPSSGPQVPGFGGVSNVVNIARNSPDVSLDHAQADLFDVNGDGLPDLIVTDPARHRTSNGQPAIGVYFNGFTGPQAAPAGEGAHFSSPVPVPVPPHLSNTMRLTTRSVRPMDVDGDGRGDFLHMPRLDRYGYFSFARRNATPSVSPRAQDWTVVYSQVRLEQVGGDPRVDFDNDGTRHRVFDVNGDGLIDIVKTTGTEMQTWLNLGFVPGGEGRFGQAHWNGSRWVTSSEPIRSCLLRDGTWPVDFADPEVFLADMNGDGITDIVRMRRGRIVYWAGRGEANWGEGLSTCAPTPTSNGAGRGYAMSSPPQDIDIDLHGVYLHDVDGDGAADLVQIGYNQMHVWFNRGGSGWTERITVSTPYAPSHSPNITFADLDGSGTTDLVYGNSHRWEYIDLLGGVRPRLLIGVENGLGATTSITYSSSAEDYLADLASYGHCDHANCDAFTWDSVVPSTGGPPECPDGDRILYQRSGECVYRSGGSPVISSVVRAVETSDNFHLVGREPNVSRIEFAYHNGYYEGIEQEFRGFGAAEARQIGDESHPTSTTISWFHQGRRPTPIATDRLAENPREALKGREYLTEVFDEAGVHLSTVHASLTVRRLMVGLDGRHVSYAYVHQTDELRYATAGYLPDRGVITVPAIRYEHVNGGALPTGAIGEETAPLLVRGQRFAWIRSTTELVDNVGNVLQSTAHGRVKREEDVGVYAPGALAIPEDATTYLTPSAINGDGQWVWRTAESYVMGGGWFSTVKWNHTTNTFDERGNLRASGTAANLVVPPYDFSGSSQTLTQTNQDLLSSTTYDEWGSPVATCGGANLAAGDGSSCLRYAEVGYDEAYAQLPVGEAIAVGLSGPVCDRQSPLCMLESAGEWDRGLGLVTSATDVNGQTTQVGYDGLGRLTSINPPVASDCPSAKPAQVVRYHITPDGLPVSVIETEAEANVAFGECGDSLKSFTRSYVDGLGRARASVVRHERLFDTPHYVITGHAILSKKGAPIVSFDAAESAGEPSLFQALSLPTAEARSETLYDAFDRPVLSRALHLPGEVGAPTAVEYGALRSTTYDPNDLGFNVPAGRNYGHMIGTPSITRVDGHGRVIEQIEMLAENGQSATNARFLRLISVYLPNGFAYGVMRAETAHPDGGRAVAEAEPVSGRVLYRMFVPDSAGRRVGTFDPDSLNPAEIWSRQNWRYLFNRVGDLVAVRDPRGCGQDFYYDHAGRLIGEEYVPCGEAQDAGDDWNVAELELPAGAIGLEPSAAPKRVTVAYHYDALPPWAEDLTGADAPPALAYTRGRATGVSDRAQRSATAYDERGNPVWTARQMAQIASKSSGVASVLSGNDPVRTATETQASHPRTYDESATYVVRTRFDNLGRPYHVTLPRDPDWALHGNQGTAPEISGWMIYTNLGLPAGIILEEDGRETVISTVRYDRFMQPTRIVHGNDGELVELFEYDVRHRPTRITATRPNASPPANPSTSGLAELVRVIDHHYGWDEADNLILVENRGETPATLKNGYRPSRQTVSHDSLYRVTNVFFEYRQDPGPGAPEWGTDVSTDWRAERTRLNADFKSHGEADPMREKPAPMISPLPPERVNDLVYRYDWLANMVEWDDDGTEAFYERKIGRITNGGDDAYLDGYGHATLRPSALYMASDISDTPGTWTGGDENRGGWLEVRYGGGGNVVGMVVRGDCRDSGPANLCHDSRDADLAARKAQLLEDCVCQNEQYYEYDWDEVNRLAEARRYDRTGGSGGWSLAVRQRYRYDASNQRLVKQTLDQNPATGDPVERVHLYVYPGRFERSGLITSGDGSTFAPYQGDEVLGSETQYTVGGARLVFKDESATQVTTIFEKDHRLTYAVKDVIQSTAAVVDLRSGELLEFSTFYPNGARETHRTQDQVSVQPELLGFTGKEADEEVGLVYFGERYLIPRIGRWASPDPLAVHAAGGGEVLNGYHYVSGNLLQARDPIGLDGDSIDASVDNPREIVFIRGNGTTVTEIDFTTEASDEGSSQSSWAMEYRRTAVPVVPKVPDFALTSRASKRAPIVSSPVVSATSESMTTAAVIGTVMGVVTLGATIGLAATFGPAMVAAVTVGAIVGGTLGAMRASEEEGATDQSIAAGALGGAISGAIGTLFTGMGQFHVAASVYLGAVGGMAGSAIGEGMVGGLMRHGTGAKHNYDPARDMIEAAFWGGALGGLSHLPVHSMMGADRWTKFTDEMFRDIVVESSLELGLMAADRLDASDE